MPNLYDLSKWVDLPINETINYESDKPRKFKLLVNAPDPAKLYITDLSTGVVRFLAKVDGYDEVNFVVDGPFGITCTNVDGVMLYTREAERTSFSKPDAVKFTKIAQRRARNPELELMMQKMQENMDRRLALQANELKILMEKQANVAKAEITPEPEAEAPAESAEGASTGTETDTVADPETTE